MRKREAEPTSKLTIRLSDALIERVKIVAVKHKAKLQDIAAEAFETWLQKAEREGVARK